MFRGAKLFSQNVRFFLTEPRRFPRRRRSPAPGGRLGSHPWACAEPLECISARMLSVP